MYSGLPGGSSGGGPATTGMFLFMVTVGVAFAGFLLWLLLQAVPVAN